MKNELRMCRKGHYWLGEFRAMASPCEVLVETPSEALALRLCREAQVEALRIEAKFSRYRDDSVVQKINLAKGRPVQVDEETARLIDFSAQCFELSDGLFDITSGVLRQAWNFKDPSAKIPSQASLDALLLHIGWQKVRWSTPTIQMPEGMQIDLGGIGKEYAVDAVAAKLKAASNAPFLVNFGGDLHASRAPRQAGTWDVGVRLAAQTEQNQQDAGARPASASGSGRSVDSERTIHLKRGAMATSGDAERFLMSMGMRYGHILNPRTGWPVPEGPRSVTVADKTCTEAGVLSTLALLHGRDAESFLQSQEVVYWCQW